MPLPVYWIDDERCRAPYGDASTLGRSHEDVTICSTRFVARECDKQQSIKYRPARQKESEMNTTPSGQQTKRDSRSNIQP